MSHSYQNILLHVIFTTKRRSPWIDRRIAPVLYQEFHAVATELHAVILAVGGVEDHVHILLRCSTQTAPADLLRELKAKSSRWMKLNSSVSDFAWQTGYGIFSVSQSNLPAVRKYIQQQAIHHKRLTFLEEFAIILKRHGLDLPNPPGNDSIDE